MKIRSTALKGEDINTRYGLVKLDEMGLVSNMSELKCKPEQLLELPDFVNADQFPASGHPKPRPQEQPSLPIQEPPLQPGAAPEQKVWDLIKKLEIEDKGEIDEEGRIDTVTLNQALRRAGLNIISQTRRDAIYSKFRQNERENPQASIVGSSKDLTIDHGKLPVVEE